MNERWFFLKEKAAANDMQSAATMERVMGIEPTQPAWKAGALPLSHTRAMEFRLHQTVEKKKVER
jgi:hypothetical protein